MQTISFAGSTRPYFASTEFLRDIVIDGTGAIAGYNGTLTPFLTRYQASSGKFSDRTFPLWNTGFNGTHGAIAAFRNYLFLADFWLDGLGWNGVIRYDIFTDEWIRIGEGRDVLDLNIGLDGTLYVLYSQSGGVYGAATHIESFDPLSGLLLNRITLSSELVAADIRGIAVDGAGRMFLAGWTNGRVFRLNASGTVEKEASTGFDNIHDIEVNPAGTVIIAERLGRVLITTTALTSFASFVVNSDFSFVTFARQFPQPNPPLPEPPATPAPTATPAPLSDIVTTSNRTIRKFTPQLWPVAGIQVPALGSPTSYDPLRGVAVAPDSRFAVANGRPDAHLTLISSSQVEHRLEPGWTNEGATGFDSNGPFLFATDVASPGGQMPDHTAGLIRFDPANNSSVRFAQGRDYIDVTCGLDGMVYALYYYAPRQSRAVLVDVYDPNTLDFVRTFEIDPYVAIHNPITALAVDADGSVFVCGRGGAIHRLAPDGSLQWSAGVGHLYLLDIDIDSSGRLVVGHEFDGIALGYLGSETFTHVPEAGTYVHLTPMTPVAPKLANISTRLSVQTGDNVGIAGFIVNGASPKFVVVRALGPSLSRYGVAGVLQDPVLELYTGTGHLFVTMDDWKDNPSVEVSKRGLAPVVDREAAIGVDLWPGAYTAIVRGKNGTGVGMVEVYNGDSISESILANISTRGFVGTNDNVMIGGFIAAYGSPGMATSIVIRGLGRLSPRQAFKTRCQIRRSVSLIKTGRPWSPTITGVSTRRLN